MDQLISQGHWWQLFPVPLVTFIFAVAGSWWGSRLGRTTEHKQWLRNEKLNVYKELHRASEDIMRAFSRAPYEYGHPLDLVELLQEFHRIPTSMFASRKVVRAYREFMTSILALTEATATVDPALDGKKAAGESAMMKLRVAIRNDLKMRD